MPLNGKRRRWVPLGVCLVVAATAAMAAASGPQHQSSGSGPGSRRTDGHGPHQSKGRHPGGGPGPGRALIAEGRQTFRYDTFGDEAFWGGTLGLHEAVATLNPGQLLALGLKVDSDSLTPLFKQRLRHGKVNLTDPAVTLDLLRMNAVVGVTGFFSNNGRRLSSIGIQCALCHSVVDDSLAPGVGRRLDGWANRDLNVGAIVAAAPSVKPFAAALKVDEETVRTVLKSWGPGKFDAELILDGKAFRPDGKPAATLIPPAFGMAGVDLATWTGWGTVTYWNAFVANLEMHGQGTFEDDRLRNPVQFPIAAANGFFNVRSPIDRITPKLAGLHDYQLSLPAPTPPEGSFNRTAAARGRRLFNGKARCATCHVPPLFTEPGWNLHLPSEIGIDDFQANRSPTLRYRTSPLRGLWTHAKGGYYHDGRFDSLEDVIDHYDNFFGLGLAPREVSDLVEYLKSL
jgi:mono/diheme cytochrome c family protein